MKRPKRWLNGMIVAGSLAAGLGSVAVGLASYRVHIPTRGLWVRSDIERPALRGAVVGGVMYLVYAAPREVIGAGDSDQRWGPLQFRRLLLGTTLAIGVAAPFWIVAPVLLVPAAVQTVRGPLRRRRRRRRGLCLHCGYDLRALPAARCPECGELVCRDVLRRCAS